MNILSKKTWYFIFSGIIIIPGIVSLILFGLHLSIDFTGGSRLEYKLATQVSADDVKRTVQDQNIEISSIQTSGENTYLIRTKPIYQEQNQKIQQLLQEKTGGEVTEVRFETVGPTIGYETTRNALKAVVFASVLIVLYIAWSFRKVPKPASSFRFGLCAIAALIHDVLLVVGIFSLLGHFSGVEIDALFVTALLTVIGFSVHDTIVVFDRIRENMRRMAGSPFTTIVNESIVPTLGRSLNTSLTVILVLIALLLFGGESIRWFVVALLVGITSGTYSSIFNASPLLVVWEEWSRGKAK